jgi:hypothetical protein
MYADYMKNPCAVSGERGSCGKESALGDDDGLTCVPCSGSSPDDTDCVPHGCDKQLCSEYSHQPGNYYHGRR